MLVARGEGAGLALACSAPWRDASVGFAGSESDGRGDVRAHGSLTNRYRRTSPGNVVLVAEIDPAALERGFVVALGFGPTTSEAAHAARGALLRGEEAICAELEAGWNEWTRELRGCRVHGEEPRLWTRSATVLKTLEAKRATGGRVAALSTPWGASRGPGIDGTYHLVWTRDLVQCLTALLAAGARGEVTSALHFLRATQERDGHWPQNMRLSGEAFWNHDELDEVALPIVFLHLVEREGLLSADDLAKSWPMVRDAADFLVRRGPATTRDRWEDARGVTPFTIATEVVALLIAADMAERRGASSVASGLRDVADQWNDAVDELLYRRGGAFADALGIDGYYVRIRKPGEPLPRDLDPQRLPKSELSPDALALVRFGLRAADDPRIVSTVRAIDAVLKSDFDVGPCWRRYPGDEYGEHEDGAPFDGHGIGRPWPLFTGERGHYELAAGRPERAAALLATMESFANAAGMLPEQIWDADDVPARGLVRGKPSGSAAPLGWAHAEYMKLCRSLADGVVFDMPAHARDRYLRRRK
jgi:glucoamylase